MYKLLGLWRDAQFALHRLDDQARGLGDLAEETIEEIDLLHEESKNGRVLVVGVAETLLEAQHGFVEANVLALGEYGLDALGQQAHNLAAHVRYHVFVVFVLTIRFHCCCTRGRQVALLHYKQIVYYRFVKTRGSILEAEKGVLRLHEQYGLDEVFGLIGAQHGLGIDVHAENGRIVLIGQTVDEVEQKRMFDTLIRSRICLTK